MGNRRWATAVAAACILLGTVPAALAAAPGSNSTSAYTSAPAPAGTAPSTSTAAGQVLRVGTYNGVAGQFTSIQAAVDAAHPGDWILVAPGDYKTATGRAPAAASHTPAGILITTPGLHLRGMNRNSVIVDGTRAGAPCHAVPADQNFGPANLGLNGVMVWKADNVSVENLTACNFLHGANGDTGNEIWWNGGDGSGQVRGWG